MWEFSDWILVVTGAPGTVPRKHCNNYCNLRLGTYRFFCLFFLFCRVRVEFFVNEQSLKERLQLYFIKNQRSSKLTFVINLCSCQIYLCQGPGPGWNSGPPVKHATLKALGSGAHLRAQWSPRAKPLEAVGFYGILSAKYFIVLKLTMMTTPMSSHHIVTVSSRWLMEWEFCCVTQPLYVFDKWRPLL